MHVWAGSYEAAALTTRHIYIPIRFGNIFMFTVPAEYVDACHRPFHPFVSNYRGTR